MITFANGKSYEQVSVLGAVQSFQGQLRNTLAMKFRSAAITLAEATELYKNSAALKEISILETCTETDSDGTETEKRRSSVQLNFTLPVELTLSEERITPQESAEIITIKVAQMSALEIMLEKHSADISALDDAVLEIGELLGGDSNG